MAVAGGAALVILTCSGCGQHRPTQPTRTTAALVAPQSATALGVRTVFKNAGLTLDPPGLERAVVSPSQAFSRCQQGDAVCPTGSAPATQLALASSDSTGTALPNGRLQPSMSKRLVYVFTWDSQPCLRAGGPPGATRSPQTCTFLNLVDAKTGEAVYSVVTPTP